MVFDCCKCAFRDRKQTNSRKYKMLMFDSAFNITYNYEFGKSVLSRCGFLRNPKNLTAPNFPLFLKKVQKILFFSNCQHNIQEQIGVLTYRAKFCTYS